MTGLIDSHCHLDYPAFEDEVEEVVERAHRAGVEKLLTIGTHPSRWPRIKALTEKFSGVFCALGLHPHEPDQADAVFSIQDVQGTKVIGIGESGLDYFYAHSPVERQKANFRTHIKASLQADLPLIIHCRDAYKDTLEILDQETRDHPPLRAVFHCFTGDQAVADAIIQRGYFISFSGIVTFPKSDALRQVASQVPLDRLLIETDAPYLAPQAFRGKRNEPAYVVHVAETLSDVKTLPLNTIAERTADNFLRLFRL